MNLSYILMDAGDFDASIRVAQENLERDPDYVEQHGNLWLTYLRSHRAEESVSSMVQWALLTGRDVEAAREVADGFVRHARSGEPQQLSAELLARVEFGLEDIPQVYAFLGLAESALDALERAYEKRSGSRSVLSMKLNPGYDFIREEPRFQALLAQLGLRD